MCVCVAKNVGLNINLKHQNVQNNLFLKIEHFKIKLSGLCEGKIFYVHVAKLDQ